MWKGKWCDAVGFRGGWCDLVDMILFSRFGCLEMIVVLATRTV